eukprot:GFKZ01000944.1.p1 GENE.GFKZ01000944.1~~GFKZ01000944.1.p1  ORF type:complete len:322 (+),score=12.00 GFKZ01000944.1:128-1093(+)
MQLPNARMRCHFAAPLRRESPAFVTPHSLHHSLRGRNSTAKWHASLSELRTGSVVVPRHRWSARMRRHGVYRSVEYRIEYMTLDSGLITSTTQIPSGRIPDVIVAIRPLKRLLPRFEREWPVKVSVREAGLISYEADLLNCTLVTMVVAACFIGVGVFGPRFVSLYSISSTSMTPTLQVGDALLVEKVSLQNHPPRRGEIVLFRPPRRLVKIIDENEISRKGPGWNNRGGALFVKRVIAVGGDVAEIRGLEVLVNGIVVDKAAPFSPDVKPLTIPEGFLFVVGDNPDRSIDSRYWGLLPVDYVVGRPIARLFPLDRFGVGV